VYTDHKSLKYIFT
jgi:hypothetical protein